MNNIPNRKVSFYRIVLWVLLIFSILLLVRLAPSLVKPEYFPSDDFVQFWAGGKLNLQGENPFDPGQIERMQIAAGGSASGEYTISIMLNPPWTVTLVMPFSLLQYPISRLAWLIFSSILILLSSQLLWRIYSGDPKRRWLAIVIIFIFGPVISVLVAGQITAIVLIGLVGFLYFTSARQNDWLAGAALSLASIKPQIAVLVWIAVLFWVIQQRRWKIILGAGITIILLSLTGLLFNPSLFRQYVVMLQTYQIPEWATPTIGAYLRYFWLGTDQFWLQFLPTFLAVTWFIYYWYRQHKNWSWTKEMPILLLISIIASSYSWTYDQVILAPAIISAAIMIIMGRNWWRTIIMFSLYIVISVLDTILHMKLSDFWFIWLAPALFIWYWLAHNHNAAPITSVSE